MILELEETWPAELIAFLDNECQMLMAHVKHDEDTMKKYKSPENKLPMYFFQPNPFFDQREQAVSEVLKLLQSTTMRGWHCTRLTQSEVEHITQNGMQLPNLQMLKNRISRLQADGIISAPVATRLKTENEADDSCRKNMIWFCFSLETLKFQWGIERFFRYWGGEALYNSHEKDPETQKILMKIGHPCLIEVNVPISALALGTYLGEKIILRYLINRELITKEVTDHEDKVFVPIMAENISKFIFHNTPEFIELTECDTWTPPLYIGLVP